MSEQHDKKKERGVWVTQAQMRLTGSPDCALFLAQCVYWSGCETVKQRSGWFYKTRDEWKDETCLSRYKQEKARVRLKELGVLQERHQRRNDGIRLWYRINIGLLNRLLNTADKQPVIGNSSVCMNDQSEKTGVKEVNSGIDENGSVLTKLCVIDNSEKEKEILILSGFSGTNVSDNSTDQHAENQGYSLNSEDYVFCHVFIYQFVKYGVPTLKPERRLQFQVYGLDNHDVFDAFCLFVETYQDALRQWYRTEATMEVPNLTADDLVFAQISGSIYESA